MISSSLGFITVPSVPPAGMWVAARGTVTVKLGFGVRLIQLGSIGGPCSSLGPTQSPRSHRLWIEASRRGADPVMTARKAHADRRREPWLINSPYPCTSMQTSPSNVTLPGQAGAASVVEDLAVMAERSIPTE
jgi:hypothetical protein